LAPCPFEVPALAPYPLKQTTHTQTISNNKETSLDPANLKNFHLISALPLFQKCCSQSVVFDQLHSLLKFNGISERFQSGFKSAHSTESALLRVLNDIYLSTDSVVLVLLDPSAAFDTFDPDLELSISRVLSSSGSSPISRL